MAKRVGRRRLLAALLALILLLGCCVALDCCISGRIKFVLLMRDQPEFEAQPPPQEQYATVESLVPGAPARASAVTSYGTGDGFYVGAIDESGSRLMSERIERQSVFHSAGPRLPKAA